VVISRDVDDLVDDDLHEYQPLYCACEVGEAAMAESEDEEWRERELDE